MKNKKQEYYNFPLLRQYMESENILLSIVIGIVDDGKTYGMKLDALERFNKFNERALFIYNSRPQMEEEIAKWEDAYENNEWEGLSFVEKGNITIAFMHGEKFAYFTPVTSIKKVARDEKIKNIYYDEFNYGDTRIFNLQGRGFATLLTRMLRAKRVFLIGNNTTLNVPILYELRLFQFSEKEWDLIERKNYKIIVHKFRRSEEFADKKYENDGIYWLLKDMEYSKHFFNNESLLDNIDQIYDFNKYINKMRYLYTFAIKENLYADIYSFEKNKKIYWYVTKSVRKENKRVVALHPNYTGDGIFLKPDISRNIAYNISNTRVFYESVIIKQNLWKTIRTHFVAVH